MIKLSNEGAGGTSFHGTEIRTTLGKLIAALGEPQGYFNDGSDKVNIDYDLELEDGRKVTVYDWKEYRQYSNDDVIEWHIGGHHKSITDNVMYQLQRMLSK